MKRLLIISLFFLVILSAGCGKSPTSTPTKLGILNASSWAVDAADWNGVSFGYIGIGQAVAKEVPPGTDHIHLMALGVWLHTVQIITINSGDSIVWTLFDTTQVIGGRSVSINPKSWSDLHKP